MNHREQLDYMVMHRGQYCKPDAEALLWALSRINALEKALQKTVNALDNLTADRLDEDSSPEFQAMQEASKLLNEESK